MKPHSTPTSEHFTVHHSRASKKLLLSLRYHWILLSLLLGGFSAFAFADAPELPRKVIDTSYSPPAGGTTHVVNAGDDLQAVLNAVQPGDIVELQAGATFTGNFELSEKSGDEWIYIRSSAHASLPAPGTRVEPTDKANMARIHTINSRPALRADFGAHNYRLIGIEFNSSQQFVYNLILVGFDSDSNISSNLTDMPDNIIFDRVYIHGDSSTNIRAGLLASVNGFALIDSYVSEIHGNNGDQMAVHIFHGPGPIAIDNNFLSGSTHNLFLGGNPEIPTELLPTDVTITRNYLFKPLSWKGVWDVKNTFEIKAASRVLFEGNVLENNWADAQAGFAVLFTPRGGTVSDVTFRKNILRASHRGFQITAADKPMWNLLFEDNLIYDIGNRVFASERSGGGAVQNFIMRHNTITSAGENSLFYYGESSPAVEGHVFYDNIAEWREYGFIGDGHSSGLDSVSAYTTGYDFNNNVLIHGSTQSENSQYRGFLYAASNIEVGFEGAQLSEAVDFRLSASSPYKNAGTDGKDIGADIVAIEAITSGVASEGGATPVDRMPPQAPSNLRHSGRR